MPSTVSWNNNNVIVTYTGVMTMECVQNAIGQILGNPNFSSQLYQINDFSQVEGTTLTATEVRMIGAMDKNANRWNDKLFCAYVINDTISELMDVYTDVMKNTEWVIAIFYSLQEGKNWIASQGFEVE
ncbi:MAG: hypothetical protein ACPGYY_07800 [Bacteroidia bacterium]